MRGVKTYTVGTVWAMDIIFFIFSFLVGFMSPRADAWLGMLRESVFACPVLCLHIQLCIDIFVGANRTLRQRV